MSADDFDRKRLRCRGAQNARKEKAGQAGLFDVS
jgi:hypothetical protein